MMKRTLKENTINLLFLIKNILNFLQLDNPRSSRQLTVLKSSNITRFSPFLCSSLGKGGETVRYLFGKVKGTFDDLEFCGEVTYFVTFM